MHAFICSVTHKISDWHLFWQTFNFKNRDGSPLREQPWRKRWRAVEKALSDTHTQRETNSKTMSQGTYDDLRAKWQQNHFFRGDVWNMGGLHACMHQTLANASPLVCTLVNVCVCYLGGEAGGVQKEWVEGKCCFFRAWIRLGLYSGSTHHREPFPLTLKKHIDTHS